MRRGRDTLFWLAVYTTLSPAAKLDPKSALSKLTERVQNALDSKGLL